MSKYNCFEKQTDLTVRNAQIVYLAKEKGLTATEISNYVTLAVSTIKTYIRKFVGLLEQAKEWFEDKIVKIYNKNNVVYECEYKKGDCAYIIEYFNSANKFVFLKIGMTNNIQRRVTECIRKYKESYDVTYAVVKKLYFAKDEEDALTLENLLRQHYKKIADCGFIKRDRFSKIRYNNEELERDIDCNKKMQLFAIC